MRGRPSRKSADHKGPPHTSSGRQPNKKGPPHISSGRQPSKKGPPHISSGRHPSKKGPPHISILGTGLIGTCIGFAARAAGARVTGWDPSRRNVRIALRRGALNHAAATLETALRGAEVVILAGPLDAIVERLPAVLDAADDGALVMDCAGVKSAVVKKAVRCLKRRSAVRFVAGHPIAGSERSGPSAASALLLKGRVFALYAPPQADVTDAWAKATRFVHALGMKPVRVAPGTHDKAVAALSALPQLAAVALALAAAPRASRSWARLAGPGYRDATRLASSPFVVWESGLRANRMEIIRCVKRLAKRVHAIDAALRLEDWNALSRLFLGAAAARRRVSPT